MILSYTDLKGRTDLVGRKVRAVSNETNFCGLLEDDRSNTGQITRISDSFYIDDCEHWFDTQGGLIEIIEDEPITWETLGKSGEAEYVKLDGHEKQEVIARVADVVMLSNSWDYQSFAEMLHIEQLKKTGYTIVQPELEKRKLTVAEAEKELGAVIEG